MRVPDDSAGRADPYLAAKAWWEKATPAERAAKLPANLAALSTLAQLDFLPVVAKQAVRVAVEAHT